MLLPLFFIDIPSDINDFKSDIDSYTLGSLISTTDEYLIPNIVCLRGCTEYNHMRGILDIDMLIQQYFRDCYLRIANKHTKFRLIESTSDDYIRVISYYNVCLHNPN